MKWAIGNFTLNIIFIPYKYAFNKNQYFLSISIRFYMGIRRIPIFQGLIEYCFEWFEKLSKHLENKLNYRMLINLKNTFF